MRKSKRVLSMLLVLMIVTMYLPVISFADGAGSDVAFNFEESADLTNWIASGHDDYAGAETKGFTNPVVSADKKIKGSKSVKLDCEINSTKTSGRFQRYSQSGVDNNLTNKTISAYVYIPSDLAAKGYSMFIYLLSTNSYVWQSSTSITATAGWNRLEYSPSNVTNGDLTNVKQYGISLERGGSDWSGNVYIDDVNITDLKTTIASYQFNSSLEDFDKSTAVTNTSITSTGVEVATSTDVNVIGGGSALLTLDFNSQSNGEFFKYASLDLTSTTVKSRVWIPQQLIGMGYSIQLYIQTSSNWSLWDSKYVTINSMNAGWNDIVYTPTVAWASSVTKIGFQISKNSGSAWAGNILIDEITITKPSVQNISFNFDESADLSNWIASGNDQYSSASSKGLIDPVLSADKKVQGTKSVKLDCEINSTKTNGMYKRNAQSGVDTNLTGMTISADVFIPRDLVGKDYYLNLFVLSTNSYTWQSNSGTTVVAGWNTITYTPTNVSGGDLSNVKQYGVMLSKGTADWSGNIYVDNVQLYSTKTVNLTASSTFESSIDDWRISGASMNGIGLSSEQKYKGTKSAALSINSIASDVGYMKTVFSSAKDFTGKKISARVFAPATFTETSGYSMKVYIKGSQGEQSKTFECASMVSNVWNEIYFEPAVQGEEAVTEYGIQLISPASSSEWTETIYVDNFICEIPYKYTFESSLDGWSSANDAVVASISTEQKYEGNSSVKWECNFSAGKEAKFYISFGDGADLRGRKLTSKLYLPKELVKNAYTTRWFLLTGDSYRWAESGWVYNYQKNFTEGWNTFEFTPQGVGEEKVKQLGFVIGNLGTSFVGNIYVDNIEFPEVPTTLRTVPTQNLAALSSGFEDGQQETKTITLTKLSNTSIVNLQASLVGTAADMYTITQPLLTTLDDDNPSTTMTVKAKPGLAPGLNEGTIKLTAYGMEYNVSVNQEVITKSVSKPAASVVVATPKPSAIVKPSPSVAKPETTPKPEVVPETNPKPSTEPTPVIPSETTKPTSEVGPLPTPDITIDKNTMVDSQKVEEGVTKVEVNSGKLIEKLNNIQNNPTISLEFNNEEKVSTGFNADLMNKMNQKGATIEIKTKNASYSLPASELNLGSIAQDIGGKIEKKDLKLNINISEPPTSVTNVIKANAKKNSVELLSKPIEFDITVTANNKTVKVNKFNSFVSRTIDLPNDIDTTKSITGVIIKEDGTFVHVPTSIVTINNKKVAIIRSMTNSVYSVISTNKSFNDTDKHWAKDDINDLASRLIINGVGDGNFEPERNITRAEFATIITKALGLTGKSQSDYNFSDVQKDSWYTNYVYQAVDHNILTPYNGEIRPNDFMTREEIMVAMGNVMKMLKMDTDLLFKDQRKYLSKYTDKDLISIWARYDAALCTKYDIIGGYENILAPKGYLKRSETAAILRKMLIKAKFI